MNPFVSVIIPNYNHGEFLRERIDSVLNQSYQNFEIIILDDCSTDNSKDIIEQYRNNNKVSNIIYNNTNSGNTFLQWEKGIALAKGEYIWIAESDDLMDSSFLEKAVSVFEVDSTIGIFQCGTILIDENDKVIGTDQLSGKSGQINGKEFIKANMSLSNSIYNASAVVFKRDLVLKPLHKMVIERKYCGDWIFWILILKASNIFLLPETLNRYRYHVANVSGKAKREGLFFFEGIGIYAYVKELYPDDFHFFDKNDRFWANRFSLSKYDLGKQLSFVRLAIKASILFPIYIFYFNILNLFKPKTN